MNRTNPKTFLVAAFVACFAVGSIYLSGPDANAALNGGTGRSSSGSTSGGDSSSGGSGLGHRDNGTSGGSDGLGHRDNGTSGGSGGDRGHRDNGTSGGCSGGNNDQSQGGGGNGNGNGNGNGDNNNQNFGSLGNRGGQNNDSSPTYIPNPNGSNRVSAPPRTKWSPKAGNSNYKSNFNSFNSSTRSTVRIQSIPQYIHPVNSLPTLVLRQSNVRVTSPYRVGYYSYGYYPGWSDNYFYYQNYVFSPYNNECLISPWYYYSMLPGYINPNGCVYQYSPFFNYWPGTTYYWNQGYYGNNGQYNNNGQYDNSGQSNVQVLDTALSKIQDMFTRQNVSDLQLVTNPALGVPIFIDGNYQYTLNGDDFYGLMRDNVTTVNTQRFTILDVKRNGYQARVLAEQDFYDAWGQQQVVYQEYILDFSGPQAIITQFGTSRSRPW